MLCPECGNPVEDPTLYLAWTSIGGPTLAYCSPRRGDQADQRTR